MTHSGVGGCSVMLVKGCARAEGSQIGADAGGAVQEEATPYGAS